MTGVWLLHQGAYSLALKALPENRQKVKNLSLPLVEVVHRGATCQNITIQSNNQKKPDKYDIAGRQRQRKREKNVLLSSMTWINGDVFWA